MRPAAIIMHRRTTAVDASFLSAATKSVESNSMKASHQCCSIDVIAFRLSEHADPLGSIYLRTLISCHDQ